MGFLELNHVSKGYGSDGARRPGLSDINLSVGRGEVVRVVGYKGPGVSLARALAMDRQILLMDEPLSALDALTRSTLQDEIERIWERDKKTVVLITNDVDEGILLADRIIPLSQGPGATLGPAVRVDLARPRDRKAINHEPRFKAIRNEVITYLTGPGKRSSLPTS